MSDRLRLRLQPFDPYLRAELEELRDGRWRLVASCASAAEALAFVPAGALCVEGDTGGAPGLLDDWP